MSVDSCRLFWLSTDPARFCHATLVSIWNLRILCNNETCSHSEADSMMQVGEKHSVVS